jgi:hypothetical protein
MLRSLLLSCVVLFGGYGLAHAQEQTGLPKSYADAFWHAVHNDQKLVVLITMDNCPACERVKQDFTTQMQALGSFTIVNYSEEPELARSLMAPLRNGLPQLRVLTYVGRDLLNRPRWRSRFLVGYDEIQSYVMRRGQ